MIHDQKSILKAEIQALLGLLADEENREALAAAAFGKEGPDGTVVRWRMRFTKGGTKYTYAAIRAAGKWYTTGPKSPKGLTWGELCSWLLDAHKVTRFQAICPDSEELIAAVITERRRQVEQLGYDLRHDVALGGSELRVIAQNYAEQATPTALVKALALLWAASDVDEYSIQVRPDDDLRCTCPQHGDDTVTLPDQHGQAVPVGLTVTHHG